MQPLINWFLKVAIEWKRGRLDPSDAFIIAMAALVILIAAAGML